MLCHVLNRPAISLPSLQACGQASATATAVAEAVASAAAAGEEGEGKGPVSAAAAVWLSAAALQAAANPFLRLLLLSDEI